ncbi:MAG TPA: SDR family oxidoreductase, partial [Polyangiaceae bacterium]|nr:SDR family oxidoreductase [Polyangiaceae bacterium]
DPIWRERCELVPGNAPAIDFGLAGQRYLELASRVTRVHHLHQSSHHSLAEREAGQINVAATREVIEFARAAAGLRSVVHYSSVFVSGDRTGVVLEEELNVGQTFRSPAEETLALSEAMWSRTGAALPVTILRSGQVVGDTHSGEVDRLDGIYPLLVFLIASPREVALPLPSRADVALHLVPVDFLARAGVELGLCERARGKTVQLVDPRPLTARQFIEAAAASAGKRLLPGIPPAPLSKTLRSNPGVRLQAGHLRALHDLLTTPVSYDDRQALSLLSESGIECPPLESYLAVLVAHVRARSLRGTLNEEHLEEGPFLVD